MAIQRYMAGVAMALLLLQCPLRAQKAAPEAAAAAPDSTVAIQDSVGAPVTPVGYFLPEAGNPISSRALSTTRYTLASQALAEVPGSFHYGHAMPGWPEGWSYDGLSPAIVTARLNGLPFNDLFSGSAQLDLLPVEMLDPLRLGTFGEGPATVSGTVRRLFGRPPLTEIRFNQGTEKRQYISVLHSQDRSQKLFGKPGRLGVLFRYGGRGSSGAYPGSDARMRQVYTRILYERPRWLAEFSYLRSRIERGAQAGVVPRSGSGFNAIYNTFSPTVRLAKAKQERHRDDLSARLRLRWLEGMAPLSVSAYLTSQRDAYRNDGDTLRVVGVDKGVILRQPLIARPGHELSVELRGGSTRFRESVALRDSAGERRPHTLLTLSDSASVLGGVVMLSAHTRTVDGDHALGGRAHFERAVGPVRLQGGAYLTHQYPSLLDERGFGEVLVGAGELKPSRITGLQAQASTALSGFGIKVRLGVTELDDPIDYWSQVGVLNTDSTPVFSVSQDSLKQRWLSASLVMDWRYAAERGFFVRGEATFRQFESDAVRGNPGGALPRADGRLLVGLRYLLFMGDMDLEAAIRIRGWTAFESRTFHAPTGHFALQEVSPLEIEPAGTVDLFIQAGIRTATIFLSAENLLADVLVPGAMLVPIYPLPARSILFGVYWPLKN